MTRLATLLCLLAVAAASAQAREPGARVRYRTPAGPPAARPWTEHPVLSAPTPLLAVSDRDTTDGGTTAGFFARLTDLGFACLAFEPPRHDERVLARLPVVAAPLARDDEAVRVIHVRCRHEFGSHPPPAPPTVLLCVPSRATCRPSDRA